MRHSNLAKLGLGVLLALALGAAPAAATAAPTVLCKESTATCSGASTYPSGTVVEASLKSGTALTLKNHALFDPALACTSSTLKGETTSQLGHISVTGLTVGGCSGGASCAAEASNVPYAAEVNASGAGNGAVTLRSGGKGNPGLRMTQCAFGVSCVYGAPESGLALEGGDPAKLVANNVALTYESGSGSFTCGSSATLSATYEVGSPKPMYASSAKATVLCNANSTTCAAENTLPSGTAIAGEAAGLEMKMSDAIGLQQQCGSSAISFASTAESGEPLPAAFKSMSFSECSGCETVTAGPLIPEASIQALGNGNGRLDAQMRIRSTDCRFGAECEYGTPAGRSTHLELVGSGFEPRIDAREVQLEYESGSGTAYCGTTLTLSAGYALSTQSAMWVKTSS